MSRDPCRPRLAVWLVLATLSVSACGQRIVGFGKPSDADAGLDAGEDASPGLDATDDGGTGDAGDASNASDAGDATTGDNADTPVCGDGVLTAGEECDPPGIDLPCTTGCGSSGARRCGDDCLLEATCRPPSEICNGLDDDCDGAVDEFLYDIVGADRRVTTASGDGEPPAIAWADDRFAALWWDERNPAGIYRSDVTDDGTVVAPDTLHFGALASGFVAMAPASGGLSVAYVSAGNLYFGRFSAAGVPVTGPVSVATTASSAPPAIASDAGRHLVAWTDVRHGDLEIYGQVVDDDGLPLAPEVRVTDAAGTSSHPSLVLAAGEFGLAWHDARDGGINVYFARLDADGNPIATPLPVSQHPHLSVAPSLAWTGTEYGVAWIDYRMPPGVYFARLDASGALLGSPMQVADGLPMCWSGGRLSWTGNDYGLVWEDIRDGDFDVFFTRLAADGARLENDIAVTTASFDSRCPQIAWSGQRFGVVWVDDRHVGTGHGSEVYFEALACD